MLLLVAGTQRRVVRDPRRSAIPPAACLSSKTANSATVRSGTWRRHDPSPLRAAARVQRPILNLRDWASSECGPKGTAARTTPITRTMRGPNALFMADSARQQSSQPHRPRLSVDGRKGSHCSRRIRFIRFDRCMTSPPDHKLRGGSLLESVLADPLVDLRARQPKPPRGFRFVSSAFLQDLGNRGAFDDAQIGGVTVE